MKIVREENSISKQKKNPDFMSNIINRIFLVCKTDKNFKLKSKNEEVESKINNIREKISNQDKLLLQAETLYKDVKKRIDILDSDNSNIRENLIESLGGSL